MAQITLTINGRDYNMACDDGEEDRILQLGAYLNSKLEMVAKSGAAKNETHLFMLTGLFLADEIFEQKGGQKDGKTNAKPDPSQIVYAGLDPADEAQLKQVIEGLTKRVQVLSSKIDQKVA